VFLTRLLAGGCDALTARVSEDAPTGKVFGRRDAVSRVGATDPKMGSIRYITKAVT